MAVKIYYQEDCNLALLEEKTIAIIDLKFIQRQKQQKKPILS